MNPSRKFRTTIAELEEERDILDRLHAKAKHEIYLANCEELKRLGMEGYFVSPYFPCDQSPLMYCVYNEDEDPCRDECRFCGEPEERK